MTPGEFLRAIWPDRGHYCIAWPFTLPDGSGKTVFAHKVCDNVSDAVSFVLQKRGSIDLYFAMFSLREPFIIDPRKTDHKTGEKGGKAVRVQQNMLAAKCFFFDIDIGSEVGKYATQVEALAALKSFVEKTQLPIPTLVSSGGGIHVYWLLENSLPTDAWRGPAESLKQLAKSYGLRVDPSRTTDTASVLRVPDTFNWKNRENPRPVQVIKRGAVTPTQNFLRLVSDAVVRAGVEVKPAAPPSAAHSLLGSNTTREYDGAPVHIKELGQACAQLKLLLPTRGKVDQSAWYHGILNTVKYTVSDNMSGRQLAHEFSKGHPEYDAGETDSKLDQLEMSVNAPSRCETIAQYSPWGDTPCQGCPFKSDASVPNPLVAARRTTKAPAPVTVEYVTGAPVTVEIPSPPAPYARLKEGGIAKAGKDSAGDETVEIIYPYDLYPIRRLVNPESRTEQQLWCVELPRSGKIEFLLDADALYDTRKFVVAIANHGIYPHKSQLAHLQDYMVAYITELQRSLDADTQSNHLGWTEGYEQFILPDKILQRDGTVKSAMLSIGAQRSSAQVRKEGTLEEQLALLNFYNRPEYLANQFMIIAGLAAPLFHMTGYHGVIVNASGVAGASKSSTLYTAASLWGNPELYPINGTNTGATTRARNERVTTLANLPVCVDEITHMAARDAVDLAMSITQPGHRLRLEQSGVERASSGSQKSTIMLTTANNSLHGLLSLDNTAGTAGSMRVFEIIFRPGYVHSKPEADAFLRGLRDNYGHVGEVFIAYVMRNYDLVRTRVQAMMKHVDIVAQIKASERYWSGCIAATLVAGEIAREIGLLPYNVAAIQDWVLSSQLDHMRGVVSDEYSDPLAVLTDYLEQINGNIITTEKVKGLTGAKANVSALNQPRGALLGHYDRDTQCITVLKAGFKDYCTKIGASMLGVLNELNKPDSSGERIVPEKKVRRVLGAGTDYAKGQSWCFIVNMQHQAIAAQAKLAAVTGLAGAQTEHTRRESV